MVGGLEVGFCTRLCVRKMSMFGCVRLKIYETVLLNISGRLTSLSDVVSAKSVRSRSNAEQVPDLQLGLLHQNSTTMSNHIISHGQVLVDDSPIHAFAWAANISRLSLMQSADPLAKLATCGHQNCSMTQSSKAFCQAAPFPLSKSSNSSLHWGRSTWVKKRLRHCGSWCLLHRWHLPWPCPEASEAL